MTERIPTQKGPDSIDPAYRDKRKHPVKSRKGITSGDTVQSPHMGDTWKVESVSPNGNATIRHLESNNVARVVDSWFSSVELVD